MMSQHWQLQLGTRILRERQRESTTFVVRCLKPASRSKFTEYKMSTYMVRWLMSSRSSTFTHDVSALAASDGDSNPEGASERVNNLHSAVVEAFFQEQDHRIRIVYLHGAVIGEVPVRRHHT